MYRGGGDGSGGKAAGCESSARLEGRKGEARARRAEGVTGRKRRACLGGSCAESGQAEAGSDWWPGWCHGFCAPGPRWAMRYDGEVAQSLLARILIHPGPADKAAAAHRTSPAISSLSLLLTTQVHLRADDRRPQRFRCSPHPSLAAETTSARPAGFCSPSASANSRPRPALSPRAPYDAGAISIAVTTLQSTPGCAASNPGSQEQADPPACSPPLVHLRAFHPSALPLAHRGCSLAALVSVHTSTHHSTRCPDSSLRSIASRAHDKVSLKIARASVHPSAA